jgi:hypothetical protein
VHRRWSISFGILAATIVLLTACGSSSGSPTTSAALIGRRIPGTGSDWQSVTAGKPPTDFAGTVTPPVGAYDTGDEESVVFFEFANPKVAATFYTNPQAAVRHIEPGPQAFLRLSGAGPLAAPSRWLNLSWCVWTGGPDPRGIPTGAPFAVPDPVGQCAKGSPNSLGIASISQRGNIVFFVQASGRGDINGGAVPTIRSAAYAKEVEANVALSKSSLALLHSVDAS